MLAMLGHEGPRNNCRSGQRSKSRNEKKVAPKGRAPHLSNPRAIRAAKGRSESVSTAAEHTFAKMAYLVVIVVVVIVLVVIVVVVIIIIAILAYGFCFKAMPIVWHFGEYSLFK